MKFILSTLFVSTLALACTTDLLVDDFENYRGYNAVGGWSSDDGTCRSTTATNQTLSILPGTRRCYFYTNFPTRKPEDAVQGNRAVIRFAVTAPTPNWSFKMNIKTWNGAKLADSYYTVTGSAAGEQVVNAPLARFYGPDAPNLRNIRSIVFESFSDYSKVWKLGSIILPCAQRPTTTTSLRTTSSRTSSRTSSARTSSTRTSSARTSSTRTSSPSSFSSSSPSTRITPSPSSSASSSSLSTRRTSTTTTSTSSSASSTASSTASSRLPASGSTTLSTTRISTSASRTPPPPPSSSSSLPSSIRSASATRTTSALQPRFPAMV